MFVGVFFLLLPGLFNGLLSGQCFTIIAGRGATDDGSVMVAHNEGIPGNFFVDVRKIPPRKHKTSGSILLKNHGLVRNVARTFGFLWLEVPGTEFGDSYMNENGVVICSCETRSREKKGEINNGGIGFMLRRIIAERAVSSRHAVELAGRLIRRFGYYSPGRTYAIADRKEAWVLHVVKGKHWVARRVPDDMIVVLTNRFNLHDVNLEDKANVIASPDLIEYARKRKWFKSRKDREFDFSAAYADPDGYTDENNVVREWRAVTILSREKVQPDAPAFPFAVKPRGKLEPGDLFRVLRDQNEDTPYESLPGTFICSRTARYSFVAQLRGHMPPEVGNLVWLSLARPDVNAYAPWYIALEETPRGYGHETGGDPIKSHFRKPRSYFRFHPDFAYWWCDRLAGIAVPGERVRYKIVRKEWRNFENFTAKVLRRNEKEFTYMIKKNKTVGLKIITNYVHRQEYRRWFQTSELIDKLN